MARILELFDRSCVSCTHSWSQIHRCLKNYQYVCYLFAIGLDGLCYLCLPMLQSLPLLVPFACTFGYFDGAYVTLIPVVTAEIVGTTSLSSALGVVYFLHAVPYLVSPPIAGKFPEETPPRTPVTSSLRHIDVKTVNSHNILWEVKVSWEEWKRKEWPSHQNTMVSPTSLFYNLLPTNGGP